MKNKYILTHICVFTLFVVSSCKQEFLDVKPDKSLMVPSKAADFQALLDRTTVMNYNQAGVHTISTDNFKLTNDQYLVGASPVERNSYLWQKDVFEGRSSGDWNRPYLAIFYANVVLEGLEKLNDEEVTQYDLNRMKGSALFFRAAAYFHLSQLFVPPYSEDIKKLQLGVPIRGTGGVNNIAPRSTIDHTYLYIISDLQEAIELLPVDVPYKTRPSKPAALALLARTYLFMEYYDDALHVAKLALNYRPHLLNYNTLDASSNTPFPLAIPFGNEEVLYYSPTGAFGFFYNTQTGIDIELYEKYAIDDLRREIFFLQHENGTIRFKGSYTGQADLFGGLATDELYLIKSECYARVGKVQEALSVLNDLLVTRYRSGTFQPVLTGGREEALTIILEERRKQLVGRGLRWSDLRRLNKDVRFQKTLKRIYQGEVYTLLPNDDRYVFPIPEDEISSSGIEQNRR